jgi:hypothetical protein
MQLEEKGEIAAKRKEIILESGWEKIRKAGFRIGSASKWELWREYDKGKR